MLNELMYGRVVNWDAIPSTEIRPGVRRKIYSTDQVMLCWHELDRGMETRPHHHDDFDQLAMILEGTCEYFVEGVAHVMKPGDMLLIPKGASHHIVPTTERCINLDAFAPPREDYLEIAATQWQSKP